VSQSRSAGGHLRAFPRPLGGFGAGFSGYFAGSLFDGVFFDHRRGFFNDGWRLFDDRWRFFDHGWRLFDDRRDFFDDRRRFFDDRRRFFNDRRRFFNDRRRFFNDRRDFFDHGWRLFDDRRDFFRRGTAFRCRFAYRRFRGAVGGVRLGINGEKEHSGHERDDQPKSKAAFGEDPHRRTLDQLDHVASITITGFRLPIVIPALSLYGKMASQGSPCAKGLTDASA
jgi:hypothetical protein